MNRTQQIIKYLEEYRHQCYLRLARARYKNEEDYYRERYKDIGNLVKELNEHGCRRTIDAN